jgi:hypothetical protein
MPRELALIPISLACLVAQWNSYGGRWKWVTILPTLVVIFHLLFAICFSIPSYVHQQLHSLNCQNFLHYNSLVFFYLSWNLSWCRVSFLKGTICRGVYTLKGHGNEADFLGFLHKPVRRRSITLRSKPFRFWHWIRGDIRNWVAELTRMPIDTLFSNL